MIFRKAALTEFDEVMQVIEDGRTALANLGLDQWQNGSPSAEGIRANIEAGQTRVVVLDGKIVGTLAFIDTGEPDYANILEGQWLNVSPNSEQEAQRLNQPVSYAVLHRVATAACATKQGVATFMIQKSCELARDKGLKSVRADTHRGNIPMQRTFEKCSMTRCCRVELSFESHEATKERIGYEILL